MRTSEMLGHAVAALQKTAILRTALSGAAGAMAAPSGHGWEGASRAAGRMAGAAQFGTIGGVAGAGLGDGAGLLAEALGAPQMWGETAGIGGALGALVGGVNGYETAGDYMGPPSYATPSEKREYAKRYTPEVLADLAAAGVVRPKTAEPISTAASLLGTMVDGRALNNARGYSEGLSPAGRAARRDGGMLQLLASSAGGSLGLLGGAAAGAGAGYGAGQALEAAGYDSRGLAQLALMAGLGGAGAGIGGVAGSQLGFKWGRPDGVDKEKKPAVR